MIPPMHIVQLAPSLLVGGMETMVMHLASWLHAGGQQVEVLFFEKGDTLQAELRRRGVPTRRLRLLPYLWRLYPRGLVRHLARRDEIVLHGHMYAWHKATAAARRLDAACVYTQHGCEERWIRKEWREMRRSARRTDAAVGVSEEIRGFLVGRLGMPEERTRCIPNGVPDIYQHQPGAPDWGVSIPAGVPVVGMVARLARPKDPDTLLEAMLVVRRSVPDAHVVFVGEGPDAPRLRELIRERGAQGFAHLLGQRTDVPRLLHHLDVFALSSSSEGHSIAVLEAMSSRRAIVATSVGGNPDLLDGGRCGRLAPPGDPRAMADAISGLLLRRDEADRLSELARQRFLACFSLDRMGEAYLALYEEVLTNRARESAGRWRPGLPASSSRPVAPR
jgi:glycosyltransferase involved in cell wall biosynthesis